MSACGVHLSICSRTQAILRASSTQRQRFRKTLTHLMARLVTRRERLFLKHLRVTETAGVNGGREIANTIVAWTRPFLVQVDLVRETDGLVFTFTQVFCAKTTERRVRRMTAESFIVEVGEWGGVGQVRVKMQNCLLVR